MSNLSANAAAFLASSLLCVVVFTANAWRKGELLAGLLTAFAGAITLTLVTMEVINGENLDRYARAVAAVPGLLAVTCLFGAEWLGVPDWVAVRTGVGLRDPRARFYEKLRVPWRQVTVVMEAARSQPHGRYDRLRKASSLVDQISKLKAPSPEWDALRDDIVWCGRDWIELARRNRNPDRWPARPHPYPILAARFEALGHEIAAERGLSLEEYGSRNKRALHLVVLTAVVVAVPGVFASWSPDLAQNQWLWLELCGLYVCVLPIFAFVAGALTWLARRSL